MELNNNTTTQFINALFFDTETTGLVSDHKPQPQQMNLDSEPFVVQLAYVIAKIDKKTGKFEILKQVNHLIRPQRHDCQGMPTYSYAEMPQQAFEVHHKSFEACCNGVEMIEALKEMQQLIADYNVTCLVAHNARYDTRLLDYECVRCNFNRWIVAKHIVCTQRMSKPFAQAGAIPATLMSIYKFFVGHEFPNAHDAFADVLACLQVFVCCCKAVGVWPVKNSIMSVQAYSNGYHKTMPTWHQPMQWNDCVEIDCVMSDEHQNVVLNKQLHIKQSQYDETACKEYNVDIEACKVGYKPQVAMQLLSHYIQCASIVVVHGAKFQLSIMHSMFVKNNVHDAFLLKPYIIDSNILACYLFPGMAANLLYVTRDDLWQHFHGSRPGVETTAAMSVLQNLIDMIASKELLENQDAWFKSMVCLQQFAN